MAINRLEQGLSIGQVARISFENAGPESHLGRSVRGAAYQAGGEGARLFEINGTASLIPAHEVASLRANIVRETGKIMPENNSGTQKYIQIIGDNYELRVTDYLKAVMENRFTIDNVIIDGVSHSFSPECCLLNESQDQLSNPGKKQALIHSLKVDYFVGEKTDKKPKGTPIKPNRQRQNDNLSILTGTWRNIVYEGGKVRRKIVQNGKKFLRRAHRS